MESRLSTLNGRITSFYGGMRLVTFYSLYEKKNKNHPSFSILFSDQFLIPKYFFVQEPYHSWLEGYLHFSYFCLVIFLLHFEIFYISIVTFKTMLLLSHCRCHSLDFFGFWSNTHFNWCFHHIMVENTRLKDLQSWYAKNDGPVTTVKTGSLGPDCSGWDVCYG